jgi:lipoic acid synthetase
LSSNTPDWLKKKVNLNNFKIKQVKNLLGDLHLNTVCQSASCPNIFECFGKKIATFMLMGNICTRNCGFCGVRSGKPQTLDKDEPSRVAYAVKKMRLKYAVITSVTRDDLADGGSSHFAETIGEIKESNPFSKIECLIPDFKGDSGNLKIVLAGGPDVLGHNIETIKRNFPTVRKNSDYGNSLAILRLSKLYKPGIYTKSGFMLGLGENMEEIEELLGDLKRVSCDIVTVGQYLRPTQSNIPVKKYYKPEEFERIKELAISFGFKAVESGIFTRSSYNAGALLDKILKARAKSVIS